VPQLKQSVGHLLEGLAMKELINICVAICVLSQLGCAQWNASVDAKRAREVSDKMAQALIEDRTKDIYQLMEKAFREAASEQDIKPMLAQLYSAYGKPLEVEFKNEEVGFKVSADGARKPMRKFWYALRTSTQLKGTYFFFTEIVPDGDSPRCSSFSIVSFSSGIPDSLK